MIALSLIPIIKAFFLLEKCLEFRVTGASNTSGIIYESKAGQIARSWPLSAMLRFWISF